MYVSYEGMIGREAVTVIDHNYNVDRKQVADLIPVYLNCMWLFRLLQKLEFPE